MTYQQVFISCLRCIMQCQVWEHKLLLGNTLNFQCENKLKTLLQFATQFLIMIKSPWHENLVCVSRALSSPEPETLWLLSSEGCHHQKPTEGAREGHSNGQEIAHQQKTAKISGFELRRRWRIIWIIAILCYLSQNCEEHFFSLLINRSYLS